MDRRSALGLSLAAFAQTLVDRPALAQGVATIAVGRASPPWIDVAAADLAADISRALGRPASAVRAPAGAVRLLLVSELGDLQTDEVRGRAEVIRGQAEGFFWFAAPGSDPSLLIVGADPWGLRRGIYAFSRDVLMLDPTWRWTGLDRPTSTPDWGRPVDRVARSPRARHRGWFINDEDLLTEWREGSGRRGIDYPFYDQVVNLEVLDQVCETAVRLGLNMISPASVLNVLNPPEAALLEVATRRGLKVNQHHIEPVGLSGFTWNRHWQARGEAPPFSFYSERERMIALWQETIAGWARHDTVWTLGLRGVGDRPMWLADPAIPRDEAVIGRLISDAIATQRALVIDHLGGRSTEFVTLLWGEGARLLDAGHLTIPEDVTIVFSDNSPGSRFQEDYRAPRQAGRRYGVYYHHQLWSSGPHLVQGAPPEVSRTLLVDALAGGADDFVLMNVSNVREFVVGITLSADVVTGRGAVQDESLEALCGRWFGPGFALAAADLYRDFFAAYSREAARARPIFLDGFLRSMGLTLIARLRDGDEEAVVAESAEARAWVQSALPDMVAVDVQAPDNRALLIRQCEGIAAVRGRAIALAGRIGGAGGRLLLDNLAAQAGILEGLGRWVLALIAAVEAPTAEARRPSIQAALAAIGSVEAAKVEAAHGPWANWYRGDRKMSIPALVADTQDLERATATRGARRAGEPPIQAAIPRK